MAQGNESTLSSSVALWRKVETVWVLSSGCHIDVALEKGKLGGRKHLGVATVSQWRAWTNNCNLPRAAVPNLTPQPGFDHRVKETARIATDTVS